MKFLLLPICILLSGCAMIGTVGTYEFEYDTYLNGLNISTKEEVVNRKGSPDKVSTEGNCEVLSYYNGGLSCYGVVGCLIVPIPLFIPTGRTMDRLYFKNGQFVTATRETSGPIYTLGIMIDHPYFIAGRKDQFGDPLPPKVVDKPWCYKETSHNQRTRSIAGSE